MKKLFSIPVAIALVLCLFAGAGATYALTVQQAPDIALPFVAESQTIDDPDLAITNIHLAVAYPDIQGMDVQLFNGNATDTINGDLSVKLFDTEGIEIVSKTSDPVNISAMGNQNVFFTFNSPYPSVQVFERAEFVFNRY